MAAKQFLDEIFDDCESIEDVKSMCGPDFTSKVLGEAAPVQTFARIRAEGVGRKIIVNFLGPKWGEAAQARLHHYR